MEQLRNYTAEDIIGLHRNLAQMELRFATGIRRAELEWDIGRLNSAERLYGDRFEVSTAYSGLTLTFANISSAEAIARMLAEIDRHEKAEREADIRTVIIESKPQPDRFISKVLNFISGGYYY